MVKMKFSDKNTPIEIQCLDKSTPNKGSKQNKYYRPLFEEIKEESKENLDSKISPNRDSSKKQNQFIKQDE